jgi:membrane protein DedA with SNARE-associated domain
MYISTKLEDNLATTRYRVNHRVTYLVTNIDELFTFFDNFGYLGILLFSFVGSIIIFIPVPYFPILVAAAFDKHLDPNLIALSSAFGSVMGKMIVFYSSYYGRKMLHNTTKRRMFPLHRLLSRYGWLGAFIAAAIPIPDDLVYITLGLAKYNPWRFASAVFSGKIVLKMITIWGAIILGRPFIQYFISKYSNPVNLVIVVAASAIILGAILYISLKVDWAKIIGKYFPWTVTDETDERETDS